MSYLGILKEAKIELIERKSIFIARAAPIETAEEADDFILKVKAMEAGATHNCSSYIAGAQAIRQKYDDDGEPGGTAGLPMLEILRKENLTNTVVVVTRYYGGIKLGAPGLVRAYAQACKESVLEAGIVEFKPFVEMDLTFTYNDQGKIDYFMQDYLEKARSYLEEVRALYIVDEEEIDKIEASLMNLTRGEIKILHGKRRFLPAGPDKKPLSH